MKTLDKISHLMTIPQKIRNIALVAHIDHGKTTLSDTLLVSAGVLAPSTAGEARALDFLPEEQRRGITMKTANISLVVDKNGDDYLINLIDSPGHVDFSGKVARALRIVDGAIVVVDAIEQIMAQTETVVRQCITEGVKPVLFINKIDRLINELKLTPKQIVERIEIIYNNFNTLVTRYSIDASVPKWQCTTKDGSVIFGSALHRWAISLPLIKEKKITFDKIVKYYQEEDLATLQEVLPLEQPLISMIIDHLPNPVIAQKYRIGKIWKGDLSSDIGQAMVNCESNEEKAPLVFGCTKILMDPHAGILTLGRVFSGTLKEKIPVHLLNTNESKKIQNIYIFMGADKKRIDNIPAGNTVAVSGLGIVNPGETIIENTLKGMTPFEDIKYLANPVVTVAIEPKMLRDLSKLKFVLEKFAVEDPNLIVRIDEQSGEILLLGLGELHLETVVKDISAEIECSASDPLVVIVEKINKSSGKITRELFDTKVTLGIESIYEPLDQKNGTTENQMKNHLIKLLQYKNEILIDGTLFSKLTAEALDNILMGVKNALSSGPISSIPVTEVRVIIYDFVAINGEKFEYTVPLLRNSVWDALRSGKITIHEPIYKIQITVPTSYLGKVTSVINKRRGHVSDVRTNNDLLIISGTLPVADSFKIDQDLRSETEGRAFWQMSFDSYKPIKLQRSEKNN
ncbi:MAG TPA: GTP-binding protein [Candidatus Bathyarchaeia archaeon]|nr:GTP-binding protein [Candidatus Bathyarchaeia archaeon]